MYSQNNDNSRIGMKQGEDSNNAISDDLSDLHVPIPKKQQNKRNREDSDYEGGRKHDNDYNSEYDDEEEYYDQKDEDQLSDDGQSYHLTSEEE